MNKIILFSNWCENNIKKLLICASVVMVCFVSIVLFSWLFGYYLNGLCAYKFELASCWGGLSAIVTGIGSILAIAGINLTHKYIDSKYNSEL